MIPWRFVIFLIALVLIICFAGFNLENISDISFGFFTFRNIPIYISLLISFTAGAFVTLPFLLRIKKPEKRIAVSEEDGLQKAGKRPIKKKKQPVVPDVVTGMRE